MFVRIQYYTVRIEQLRKRLPSALFNPTHYPALSALLHIHELIDAPDWLILPWLTGASCHSQRARLVLLPCLEGFSLWCSALWTLCVVCRRADMLSRQPGRRRTDPGGSCRFGSEAGNRRGSISYWCSRRRTWWVINLSYIYIHIVLFCWFTH